MNLISKITQVEIKSTHQIMKFLYMWGFPLSSLEMSSRQYFVAFSWILAEMNIFEVYRSFKKNELNREITMITGILTNVKHCFKVEL